MNTQEVYNILLRPYVSEKSMVATETNNQYVFKVKKSSTKNQVKQAVEKLFDVKVSAVNTVLVKGKTKMFRQIKGKRSDWKKAYVTLAQGHNIQLMAGE